MIEQIHWLGHGSFIIDGPPTIAINPWRVTQNNTHMDAILVGHDHYDHCSPADINKLRTPETQVISNSSAAEQIEDSIILRPWQSLTLAKAAVKAIPAYSPDAYHHPIEADGLGFLISLNYYDIYYAGDTGLIPEMARLQPDIALLPIDGNGTLTVEEAAQAVQMMRPRWTIPFNWGSLPDGASKLEAQAFSELASPYTEVIILEKIR